MRTDSEPALPGAGLAAAKMPGHWLLARLGKRVLRPGGLDLTRSLLCALGIRPSDAVVEFAPGFGATTRMVRALRPASYVAVEQDEAAAGRIAELLTDSNQRCLIGSAEESPLRDRSATVVYGEAMLTMQGLTQKRQIIHEASRILKPGGRYGIHELCLIPDDLDEARKTEIQQALSAVIHVGARPLTATEWRSLLEDEGFNVRSERLRPMRLLKPSRLLADEGLAGALRFAWNLCRDAAARERVLAMRRIFEKYRPHLAAIMLVGIKRSVRDWHDDFSPRPTRNNGEAFPRERTSAWNPDWRRARFS